MPLPHNDVNDVIDERGIGRRTFLAGAGAALAAGALAACGDDSQHQSADARRATSTLHGRHQPGIATRPQGHLQLAAFELRRDEPEALRELLATWTATAEALMRGERAGEHVPGGADPATGLDPAGLSVTLGLGPALFRRAGSDRLGLAAHAPAHLAPLPSFPGDALEGRHGGGDLCVQACADDPQVAFNALHALAHAAVGIAALRWTAKGFLPSGDGMPRNLMGFKDGTGNIAPGDAGALDRHVWAAADEPEWMHGGTYMVVRRVRTLLDVWDATSVEEQEAAVGRRKGSGAPLGGRREHDAPDLDATVEGVPVIPSEAHIRLAAPATNGGVRILRRSYNYADAVDPATGQADVGLIFIAFQRDPAQFVRIQERLARHDALRKHLLHTGSAVFACPPGVPRGTQLAAGLFD